MYTAAAEIERSGGNALPIVGDVRNDDLIREAVLAEEGVTDFARYALGAEQDLELDLFLD